MADFENVPDLESGKLVVPTDVADAIRTLIRWAGDDPSREGLFCSTDARLKDQLPSTKGLL